ATSRLSEGVPGIDRAVDAVTLTPAPGTGAIAPEIVRRPADLDGSAGPNPPPVTEGSHVAADGVVEHPTASDYEAARSLPADSIWFKRAVFHEALARAFHDSNGDGQ